MQGLSETLVMGIAFEKSMVLAVIPKDIYYRNREKYYFE